MERTLNADPRDGGGKGSARKLRSQGKVPGVLFGAGVQSQAVAVDARELYHVLHTDAGSNVLIDLHVGRKRHLAMPREVQRDHVRGQVLHVDFIAVRRDEKITVDVPVQLTGESPGVKEGGVVEHHLWEVKVETLPNEVPENIEADISGLAIGDSLRVSDLKPPSGAVILTEPSEAIVHVVPPPVLRVEEEVAVSEEAVAEAEGATGEQAEQKAAGSEAEGGEGAEEGG